MEDTVKKGFKRGWYQKFLDMIVLALNYYLVKISFTKENYIYQNLKKKIFINNKYRKISVSFMVK